MLLSFPILLLVSTHMVTSFSMLNDRPVYRMKQERPVYSAQEIGLNNRERNTRARASSPMNTRPVYSAEDIGVMNTKQGVMMGGGARRSFLHSSGPRPSRPHLDILHKSTNPNIIQSQAGKLKLILIVFKFVSPFSSGQSFYRQKMIGRHGSLGQGFSRRMGSPSGYLLSR